ncbi:MAG: 50S ribosomal protein L28 [Proteobacteria bacterium]|nr:50S ribosomal protein L28 [Pseudomonadota bacterium]
MSRRCELLGVGVMSGNKISHSNRKTKRRFLPNLKTISFKSETLGIDVSLKVTAASIRTVNKYGNIDNFLVNCRHSKLTESAKKLRLQIKKKLIKLGRLEEVKIVKEKKVVQKKATKKA